MEVPRHGTSGAFSEQRTDGGQQQHGQAEDAAFHRLVPVEG